MAKTADRQNNLDEFWQRARSLVNEYEGLLGGHGVSSDFESKFSESAADLTRETLNSVHERSESVLSKTEMFNLRNLMIQRVSFPTLMAEVLRSTMEVVPCQAGSILEIDRDSSEFFFAAVSGPSCESLLAFRVPVDKGLAGSACATQKTIAINAGDEDQRHLEVISDAIGFEVSNLVAIPIVIQGHSFGVLEVINRIGKERFDEADIERIEKALSEAALVIEDYLLEAQEKKRIDEMSA